MSSKLSRYADGMMEAAWLAAVIVVPAFFNIYSSRIFEPDKLALLRTLALFVLAAWTIKLVDEGRPTWERLEPGGSRLRTILRLPLLAPVLALAAIYLLSTLLSVAPRISLLGSYQRLQGTYTTFSYLVIFAAMITNLRRRAQVERLITTAILVSLPVSMYGVLQRFQIDPVPWAGNVTRRIASNMGNSIFVAAYLIMVTPLTLGRIVDSFGAILREDGRGLPAHFTRATVYVFIVALQLIAIYFSGSRGPLLGLLAALFFLFILLSLHWRKRWMTFSIVGAAGLVGLFLVLLNVPGGPLETIRQSPAVGRLGQVLDMDQRTSQVRILIWEGAAQLVQPHDPLQFPDGDPDALNFIRPLIGYGPEAMHVAYNKFFPPELAAIEKRNASPDRSHNETWDALVTTGLLGLGVYLVLFAVVFYYGLRWLGMVNTNRQRNLLLALYFGGGLVSAVAFILVLGIEFFGVGLPFGAILGLILYLTLRALAPRSKADQTSTSAARAYTLMVILAAIVAHFVEINFGIAIAATRTYFWVYAALLLLVGYILPLHDQYQPDPDEGPSAGDAPQRSDRPERSRGRSRRRGDRPGRKDGRPWLREALVGGVLAGLLLATLGYDFINVQNLPVSAPGAIWRSFTQLPNREGAVSYGVLGMLVVLWLAAGALFTTEREAVEAGTVDWRALPVVLGVSGGVAGLYWLWHAGNLITVATGAASGQLTVPVQAAQFENLLTTFYVFLIFLLFGLGYLLPSDWPVRLLGGSGASGLVAPVAFIAAILLAVTTNLQVIQADITFKLADPLARSGQWQPAVALYERVNELAMGEDHYYLFLGKTLLESAQVMQTPVEQDQQVQRAEESLLTAQKSNPLNTDHTANLARLYRWWATRAPDQATENSRSQTASGYYDRALALSPNNVVLWGEWASLYLSNLQDSERAFGYLEQALALDPNYEGIHALLGDYYLQASQRSADDGERQANLEQAASHYEQAIELLRPSDQQVRQKRYNYRIALGGVQAELKRYADAIETYRAAVGGAPGRADRWRVEEVLASLYLQIGDTASALAYANNALLSAPESARGRLQAFVNQLQASP